MGELFQMNIQHHSLQLYAACKRLSAHGSCPNHANA
jgi:hypothetical protein